MLARHISHRPGEFYDIVDSDPDCDIITGEYIGLSDMIKLSDNEWYPLDECYYINLQGDLKPCAT